MLKIRNRYPRVSPWVSKEFKERKGADMKVNWFSRFLLLLTIIFTLFLGVHFDSALAGEVLANDLPVAELPAIITSCGQSPDAFIVKILCDRNGVLISYGHLMTAEDLKGIKTLLVVIGGSAKGLGEAGIDEDDELARVGALLDKANEEKIMVFGIHIGGEARRGELSAKFIELTTPRMKYLIVTEDGNKDGYFSKVSAEKKIPLFIIKSVAELGEVLKKVFQSNN